MILIGLTNLVWLAIYPPRPQQVLIDGQQQWKCYNIQFAVLIETDSIFSVLFVVLLILITMFFSVLTWKSKNANLTINSFESRWIMFSGYVMLITWTVWAFLFKMFHLVELRDLFIVIANLLVATSILICMFIRKLIIFYRLNKAKKYNNKTHHHLVSSPSISSAASYNGSVNSSYYGSVGSAVGRNSNKKINEQLKRTAKQSAKQMAKATKEHNRKSSLNSTQMNQDNLDNVSTISMVTTSSLISSVKSYFTKNNRHDSNDQPDIEPDFHLSSITTVDQPQFTSSVNQQPELYPMDVYEAYESGSKVNNQQNNQVDLQNYSQQPDSLFYTTKKSLFNSNHSVYLEKDYM